MKRLYGSSYCRFLLRVVFILIGFNLIISRAVFADGPVQPVAHQPPPDITGNESGATTTLGEDGSTTTTVTTENTASTGYGQTRTTTTTQTVTLNGDGTQTTSTTTTVTNKKVDEVDQDGSMTIDSDTTTTTTTRKTDIDGNTTTTTTQTGSSRNQYHPADYDPDSDDMYAEQPYDYTTPHGRTTTTTQPDGTTSSSTLNRFTQTVTTTTDPSTGTTTTNVVDVYGNPVSSEVSTPNGGKVKTTYNKDGSKTVEEFDQYGKSVKKTNIPVPVPRLPRDKKGKPVIDMPLGASDDEEEEAAALGEDVFLDNLAFKGGREGPPVSTTDVLDVVKPPQTHDAAEQQHHHHEG